MQMNVGVLFADVRGFTSLAEHQDPGETTALLNRFYEASIRVLCRHAIIDKLVGDQVMALYLPQLLGDPADHMVADARDLLAAAPADLDVGIGLDYGMAFVGNVGSGEVKDFTAIGDVVNTAARLQACAEPGQVVMSERARANLEGTPPEAAAVELRLKGKAEPVQAWVVSPAPPARGRTGVRLPR